MASATQAAWLRRLHPFGALRRALRARTAAWVRRRQGEDQLPVTLERRRLYILPTRGGMAFAALIFVMLLAGLNYRNSLALFLTFLLAAFALVAMQLCHRNLQGITVIALHAPAVFAQRPGSLFVTLGNTAAVPRLRLEAALEGTPLALADVPAGLRSRLAITLPGRSRGVVRLARVRIATAHPFGLFRAWTWVHTSIERVIYPAPAGSLPMPQQNLGKPGNRPGGGSGLDEWLGLRPFRDGDSPRQVDWKAYAREAPLLVKMYQPLGSDLKLFDFNSLPHPDFEARLSQLARWLVDAEARGERYGLTLPGSHVPANHGPEHRHDCLVLLARFGAAAAGAG